MQTREYVQKAWDFLEAGNGTVPPLTICELRYYCGKPLPTR